MFNEDGSMKFKASSYFDTGDYVCAEVLADVEAHDYPGDSDAVALYYADLFSGDGITAYTLFCGGMS